MSGVFAPDAPDPFDALDEETPNIRPLPEEEESRLKALDLTIRLSDEERKKLGRRIGDEIYAYQRAIERRLDNVADWRRAHECTQPGTANVWEGASDIPSPNTRIYCNSHHTRLNTQILNAQPPFVAVAKKADAVEMASVAQDALASFLEAAEWAEHADQLHGELVIAGNCFWKTEYVVLEHNVPVRQVQWNKEDARGMTAAGIPLPMALHQSVEKVHFTHQRKVKYDGLKYKVIPFEDGVILPATIRKPEECYGIGERYMVRGCDLRQGVKDGYYFEEAVDDLLERQSDSQPQYRMEKLQDHGVQLDQSGPAAGYGDEGEDYREYDVYDLDWLADFNGDGYPEWASVVLHADTDNILSLRYLDHEDGTPRTMMFRYITRTAELFAMGIPELIACFQDADVAVLNQLVNHADLAINTNGNFWYDDTAGFDPDRHIAQLGVPTRVENINGIKEKQMMQLPAEHYQLNQKFKDICDLLTASSNPSLGKTTDAGRTLGEVQIVLGASNMIFEDYAGRVARAHAKCWDKSRWLVAQRGMRNDSDEIEYRRVAAPDMQEFLSIPPKSLTADIDFVPTGLEQLADLQTRIQQATLVRSSMMMDPLVAGIPGMIPPNTEAMEIIDRVYLKTMKYQEWRQLVAAIGRGVHAAQQAQQMEMMMGGMMGGQPGQSPPEGAPPGAPQLPQGGEAQAMGGEAPPPGVTGEAGMEKVALGAGAAPSAPGGPIG